MLNKQKEKMLKYGEWLEKYLNPGIKPYSYKNLFNEGTKLINAHETIDPESDLIKKFETNSFQDLPTEYETFESELVDYTTDGGEDPSANICWDFMFFNKGIYRILKEIRNSNLPWEKVLYDCKQISLAIFDLEKNYSKLYQTVRGDYGEFKKTSSFLLMGEFEGMLPGGKMSFNPKTTVDLGDVYGVIIAKIFFDFLFMGGDSHFIFCEYCNQFTVVRRKGKRFCSDICRTTANSK